jgi:NADPH:quinone reductase
MVKAIVLSETGGPEVMVWKDVDVGDPGPGEARVRHTAVGVNYIDIYFRTGTYPLASMPASIGMEAAGIVEAVGEGVDWIAVGDRIAYACPPPGAYCEARVMSAKHMVRIPDGISDDQAASLMLKGMTAEYLLHRTQPVGTGDTILVHAAAGGVGLMLCGWARALGATVIGTVSTEEKARAATAAGAHHVILYRQEDFAARVAEITGGSGVRAVYDGVGRDTFDKSLDCLALRGHMVLFGAASGPVPPVEIASLARKSNSLTRPTLFHYAVDRPSIEEISNNVFNAVQKGWITATVDRTLPLASAADAHRALEGRETMGAIVLKP